MTKYWKTTRHWFPLSPFFSFIIQTCKQWILRYISVSAARTAATGRYLVALANSYPPAPAKLDSVDTKATSTRRRRLHLLYIVNDVLYHAKYRDSRDESTAHCFTANIEPSLLPLVAAAASFPRAPKQIAKIRSLLELWANKSYFAEALLSQLRAAVDKAVESADGSHAPSKIEAEAATPQTGPGTSKAPFVMPAWHGDPATPWYDLPAANWLAVLEPNSTRPMNPNALKPLKMAPGPAPPELVASVQSLLVDVDRMFGEGDPSAVDDTVDTDIDALGEHVEIDAFNGDILSGDSYYGWSRAFCKKMKERAQPKTGSTPGTRRVGDQDRGRRGHPSDDSRSPSPGSPRPAFKKRRYSDDDHQSRSRSRSADDRRNDTGLRVPSRDHRRHSRGRSTSRSRSRSRSFQRYSKSRSRSRSRSRSPRGNFKQAQYQQQHHFVPGAAPPLPVIPGMPGMPLPGAFPFATSSLPPPPPGYQGPWPPLLPAPPLFLPPNPQQQWPQPPHMPVPPDQGQGPSTSNGGWSGGWSQYNASQQQPPNQKHNNNRGNGRGGRGGWNNNWR